ncbi:cof family hydrolase [Fictibacillus macauensis ZFHKF-1]|uniref:Cof family hydrolase n=1 Tax=Fictibacillus macauensis ZFHKF-1 TaxID=1196324 RepID=I8J1J2_9BACL|nr:Cof-type HAD-IIB family hydrolase [Fictibacillus macauensis]EIT85601.1 cof family hydrolase [Fictibacillus macauensis ZFHKF-1]
MKLVAIDLDGTLLHKDKKISEENARAIREAQSHGITVSICTGRAVSDVLHLLEEAGLTCPVIGANGAVIVEGNNTVCAFPLLKEEAYSVLQEMEKEHVFYHLHTNQGIYTPTYGEQGIMAEIQGLQKMDETIDSEQLWQRAQGYLQQYGQQHIASFTSIWNEELIVYKLLPFSYSLDKLARIEQKARQFASIFVTSSSTNNLEINHKEANKGNGLQAMADHLSIPYEHTVAIGDNLNDLPMMKVAGTSIAMGNALNEIKAYCDFTTLPHDMHGVAHAIRTVILKQAM